MGRAERPTLPESLPIAIESVEAHLNGSLVITLCWLQENAPREPPRVEVEFRDGQFTSEVHWHHWQPLPRAAQKIEIKGTNLIQDDIDVAEKTGLSVVAVQWTQDQALRLRILPN